MEPVWRQHRPVVRPSRSATPVAENRPQPASPSRVAPAASTHAAPRITIRLSFRFPKGIGRWFRNLKRDYLQRKGPKRTVFRISVLVVVAVVLANVLLPYFSNRWSSDAYALDGADKAVISQANESMGAVLKHDLKEQSYSFNTNYQADGLAGGQFHQGGAQIKATLHDDLTKGVTINDPVTSDSFTITPQVKALYAKQSSNQIQYPIYGGSGALIYTTNAVGVKEDILLRHEMGDTLKLKYKLGLGNDYAAKLLADGSLAIYGSNLPLDNVSTSTDKDAKLLAKARQNAVKDTWLFTIPPPTVHASGDRVGKAHVVYQLKGDILTIVATNMKSANYPLSIDPTVQISTTNEFYRNTSIESNADFDATNNQITRGALTGGTTGTWTATTTLGQGRFLAGATAYNGNVYVVGGAATSASTTNLAGTNANAVEYASISTASPSVFGSWAAGNHSGLPAGGLSRFQLIGYHGFLYAIGGSTTDTTCGTLSSTVYYASVQVNGVLGNWATTNAPATARCSFGATAYGGKIYIAGGKTGSATGTGTTDVSYAVVNPDGTLTWTSGTTPALPAARYGNDLQAYNGYLYVVGGMLSGSPGTLTNTVLYNPLNTDGTIYNGSSNWASTNTFTTARENLGAIFSVIKNGYIYLSGGCSAINGSQTCTTVQSDTQLAQINADGSLGQWATTTSLTAARVGSTEVVWRGTVYNVAGCLAMSAGAISCSAAPVATTQYGTIASAGQASVLKTTTNYPLSVFGATAAVLNGYLYVVGGCTTNDCQSGSPSVTNQTYYAQIASDGTLGSWSNNAANTINGTGATSGIAEMALVAANGSLYGFGGYNDSAPSNKAWIVTPSASTGALPGAWTASTGNLAATVYAAGAMYIKGTFIVIGGCVATAGSFGCSTYRTAVTKYTFSGTTITNAGTTTALSAAANFSDAAFGLAYYYGYIYLCGGTDAGQAYTQFCTYGKLDPSALTVASWTTTTGKFNVGTSPDHPIRRSSAYASNGYLYVFAGHDGLNLAPVGNISIGKINPSTGNVSSDFTVSTTAFTAKWDTASAFADGNVYTVGGCTAGNPPTTCTARTNATEYFQIYNATNSGNRANANSGNAIPTGVSGNSAVAYNGYLYQAGGCSVYTIGTTTCTTAVGSSSFAAINPDGSIGTWTAGPSFPSSALRGYGCMVQLNGTLYYMGGVTSGGTAQSDVYYSTASGSSWGSGTWAAVNAGSATGKLLAIKGGLSCSTWNNRIYAVGGSTSTTVYYSPSLPSGGDITSAWTATTTSFTTSRSYHAAVAVGGYLYVIGGFDGTNYLSDTQFAQIASSGNITATWAYTNDLPYKERQMSAYAANGYIYVLGGATGTASTSCLGTQNVASVNTDGTLGYWQEGVATSFTARMGSGVAYYNGYYYVVGGNDCSANTTTSNVTTTSYAGEQSQAIRSIFTRYIDMVGDATPWKFVINGSNAAVNTVDIENWRLTYNSSRIATNAFGASTIVTPLNFGPNPFVITAIDGSSVNQGVSRYWQLTFDIDQTNSFAFADVNISPPAIVSYSFYYAPSGNTRLRNGGIFQDQTHQSLDAHP